MFFSFTGSRQIAVLRFLIQWVAAFEIVIRAFWSAAGGTATTATAAATSTSAAATGDADVSGRLGDRSDGDLSGATSTAATAAGTGTGAGLLIVRMPRARR